MIQKGLVLDAFHIICLFMWQTDKIKILILEELAHSQAKNPAYSMRAFAKRLGVSQAAISQILADKRPLTKKTAEKILRGLDKSPTEIFDSLEVGTPSKFKSVDMDSYHLIADWYHYAILSLAETPNFKSSTNWIAHRLGISVKQAQDAINLLLRLDMLQRDRKTKKLSITGEQFEAISEVANPAMEKAARQDLDLAIQALDQTQFDERNFTAMTLCFDPARSKEAIQMIKNFRRSFCKAMESKNKKEVYRLNVQLFPLSKKEGKK
jgi:transcriptional regulator with XRE-family HTH domain